jgi:Rieske Fe-S protein
LGVSLTCPLQAGAQTPDAEEERPHEGDSLVFAGGSRAGEVIAPQDVPLGGPQVFAYPMDPATGVPRTSSRLNQVLLVRLDPADLTTQTRERAADGIVAYSAVCSHTGCDVNGWLERTRTLHCECHDSEFNPADAANVEFGPAPRRLSALPLRIAEGALEVAGGFIGRVGAAQR